MPLATRRDIGQFLIGSTPGTTIPVELRSLAREFDLGGVILFSRNIEVPEQVAELAAESEMFPSLRLSRYSSPISAASVFSFCRSLVGADFSGSSPAR